MKSYKDFYPDDPSDPQFYETTSNKVNKVFKNYFFLNSISILSTRKSLGEHAKDLIKDLKLDKLI